MATRSPGARFEVTAEDKTRQALDSANKRLEASAKQAAKYGAALAAAAVAGAGVLTARSLKNVDALAKQADALDVNIGKLRALQLQGELTGTSTEQINTNLERMQRRLGEVARRGGATELALTNIGISIDDILNLPADEQLQRLAVAMGGVENAAVRASIANDLFGRDGARMLKLLNQLEKEGLGPTEKALEAVGASLSRIDAAQIENANDAMTKAATVAEGFGNQLALRVAPLIEAVAGSFFDSAVEAEGWGTEIQFAVDVALRAVGVFADALHAVKIVWRGLVVVAAQAGENWGAIFETVNQVVAGTINNLIDLTNKAIVQLNKIKGVDITPIANVEPLAAITNASEALTASADQAKQALSDAVVQELPSKRIVAAYNEIQKASREAAESAVANASGSGGGLSPLQQQLAAEVAAIQGHMVQMQAMREAANQAESDPIKRATSLFTEQLDAREAALTAAMERRKATLQQSLETEVIDEHRHRELLQKLEADHQSKLESLRLEKSNADRLAQDLVAFEQSLLSKSELEAAAFASRQEMLKRSTVLFAEQLDAREAALAAALEKRKTTLQQSLDAEVIDEQRHRELLQQVEADHQAKLESLRLEKSNADRLAQDLVAFEQSLLSKSELEMVAFASRQEMLNQALEMEYLTEERHRLLMQELENGHQKRLTDIVQDGEDRRAAFLAKSMQAQVQQVAGDLMKMTQGVANSNKTMFRLNKMAGIANAIVNTSVGVTKALSEYPPPLSFAMAAAQLAAGVAQVQSIRSTSFGGGTTPSSAGSAPSINNQPVQSAPSIEDQRRSGSNSGGADVTVIVPRGELTTTEAMRNLLEKLDETARDMPLRNIRVVNE